MKTGRRRERVKLEMMIGIVLIALLVLSLALFLYSWQSHASVLLSSNEGGWCGCDCPVGYVPTSNSNQRCLDNACGGACSCKLDSKSGTAAFLCFVTFGVSSACTEEGICAVRICELDSQCAGACGLNAPPGSYDCCLEGGCGCCT